MVTSRPKGTVTSAGYLRLTVAGRKVLAHRMVAGALDLDPAEWQVDHIDGDRLHNHKDNLRIVRVYDNSLNKDGSEYRAMLMDGYRCRDCEAGVPKSTIVST